MRKISFGQQRRSLLDKLIALVRINKVKQSIPFGSTLLDLGCGYEGELLNELNEIIREGNGRDLSVNPQNKALSKGRVDSKLPYKENYFDTVTALAIIEHVDHPELMLAESYRVLRSGGKIVITTPSLYGKIPLEIMAVLSIISKDEINDHKRYYTKETLKKDLIAAGFNEVKVKHFGIMWMNLIGEGFK